MPGPVPKRSDQRRRRNKTTSDTDKAAGAKTVKVPAADRSWHPIAKSLGASLATSGQAEFYEPSDWAFAFSLMDDLSYIKKAQERDERRPAQMLQTVYTAFERLLVTEGDRRRVRLELERGGEPDVDPAKVAIMDEYRAAAT